MIGAKRMAIIVAAGAILIYFALSAIVLVRTFASYEYARVADIALSVARDLAREPEAQSRGDSLLIVAESSAIAASVSLTQSDRQRMFREDKPLVLGSGVTRLVTAPVKDSDDWEIVGAVGVATNPYEKTTLPLAILVLGATAAGATAVAGLNRISSRSDRKARGMIAVSVVCALLTTIGILLLIREAGQTLQPADAAPPAGSMLPPAGFRSTALILTLIMTLCAATVCATGWVASARRHPAALRETLVAWGFLAPSLVHLLIFSAGPLVFALFISFHRWDLVDPVKPFVAAANYIELFRDPLFWNALRNTAIYSLYVPLTMMLALAAAMILNQPLRGIGLLRTMVFMPYVASFVAIAIVWQWIFNFDFGLLNWLLAVLHVSSVDWLGNPRTALLAVMIVAGWVQMGYQMVIYLAALQGIPEPLYEAASLDGARAWDRFRHITLPLLQPASIFIFVTGVIWSFQVFTLVYVMTEGGPLHSTDVLVYQIYQNAWEFSRMGYAAAMSWVLFAILFLVTLAQWKLLNRKVDYA
ncbi:MAG: carbohydrate ABC transporter permease [Gemmatimonadaceae bacterium]